jgi:hypothetical protein
MTVRKEQLEEITQGGCLFEGDRAFTLGISWRPPIRDEIFADHSGEVAPNALKSIPNETFAALFSASPGPLSAARNRVSACGRRLHLRLIFD